MRHAVVCDRQDRLFRVQEIPGWKERDICLEICTFDLPDSDYAKARAIFVQMKEDASHKVEEIKKDSYGKVERSNGQKLAGRRKGSAGVQASTCLARE
jgi:hypothetical protein